MITIQQAFAILEQTVNPLEIIEVPLWEARFGVLAETLFSPIDMPPFRQSNMDGYALALHEGMSYAIVGEFKAGDGHQPQLKPGQAVKIFTGAAVPDSVQAVIQIEKVKVNGNILLVEETVLPETNVRPQASQIKTGAVALEKGTVLNPAAIGFLSGLGFSKVKIFRKPSVGIIVTGNELVPAGETLSYGKIYESNALMLQAALYKEHFEEVIHYQVKDDFESTRAILEQAIKQHDVVLVSGGISVGDYDFVGKALESVDAEILFYKVNQKPGKPLMAAKLGDTLIFALPGNPAASLTCCCVYVLPTLHKLSGRTVNYGAGLQLSLAHDLNVANSRDQFLKASVTMDEVTILPHQDSSMLDSFAIANALVYVGSGNYTLPKGDKVVVYPL